MDEWKTSGQRSLGEYKKWNNNLNKLVLNKKNEFLRRLNGKLPKELNKIFSDFKKECIKNPSTIATRQSSELVINKISPKLPELIGGSADLTGSNNTRSKKMKTISTSNYKGEYIYYGIREHGMAAVMNGLALHKGIIPFGGTFLIFVDYCKPSLRLAALMKQRAIYILTHDSIGLGEDGPTHQPIEQLASLRATPNVKVIRPSDTVETIEAWQIALNNKEGPTVIALTRQKLTPARKKYTSKNLSELGAYELKNNSKKPQVSIYASGSEVEIASELMEILTKKKITSRIISVPCFELFKSQNKNYKKTIFGNSKINISIEAGSSMGWNEVCPNNLIHASIDKFGASAPYKKLYDFYGLTASKIYKKISKKL